MTTSTRTQVAIIGAGPAGLMLAELLKQAGVDSVVVDNRSREVIEGTIKAGILEHGAADVLVNAGVTSRADMDAVKHDGVVFEFAGRSHRFDFPELVGKSVFLYPQHQVLIDQIAKLMRDGHDLRFNSPATAIVDGETAQPRLLGTGADGEPYEIVADFIVGADGSRSMAREFVNGSDHSVHHFREYPFAWYGILCEAPKSSEELIYANSPAGFALISQRSDTVQRMYLQCDPKQSTDEWSDEEIWDRLQACVPNTELKRGPIFQRDVLVFRSFVAREFSKGRVFLAGDAAHTVPPTGAKGLNLAFGDILILNRALQEFYASGSEEALSTYGERASKRIWRAEHYSWWMTQMLHTRADDSSFDRNRQLGELELVTSSIHGQRFLAEGYVGWDYEV